MSRSATALIGAFALFAALPAQAQTWPIKPVRMIVPGPAGGTVDTTARLLAEGLKKDLDIAVIVDPHPGAAGAIAINELLVAPSDGHTVLVGPNSLVSEIPHIVKLKIDPAKAMTPLAVLARSGLVLVCTPALPVSTLPELIALLRAHPDKRSYASYSPGTISHILGFQLGKATGTALVHIGYKGSPPALADVMGGHVSMMFDGMPTSLPLIRAGRLKALAVTLPARSPLLPDVPTVAELGYPQLEAVGWVGLWATPGVPAPIQFRLRESALKVMTDPRMSDHLKEIGFESATTQTIDELKSTLRADYNRIGALLKAIGFKEE